MGLINNLNDLKSDEHGCDGEKFLDDNEKLILKSANENQYH